MKRKKRGLSKLTKILLCSWCVLALVLSVYLVHWALNLEDKKQPGSKDAFAQSTPGAEAPTQEVEQPDPTATPTPEPVRQAEFTKVYEHHTKMEEVISYKKGVAYGLRYPTYESEKASASVKEVAEQLLSEELEKVASLWAGEPMLLIDYEDNTAGELLSVVFYVSIESGQRTEERQVCWVFNKKKDEVVEPDFLFTDLTYSYVAKKVNALAEVPEPDELQEERSETGDGAGFSEELYTADGQEPGPTTFTGTREEFGAYLLTEEGARFYYNQNGTRQSVVIPYVEIYTYMMVTPTGMAVMDNIRELDPDKPMIALTFDDGPHYQRTPLLLEVLEQYDVKATFFVLGDRANEGPANRKTVQAVAEAGHEIASHTYSHKNLKTLTLEQMTEEIMKARDSIYQITGEYPVFVRPPYGAYSDLVKENCYAPLITWNLDSKDWDFRDAEKVVDHVLEEAGNGKIVLMHDIHQFTIDAVKVLVPELIERGYQIVTVRELFYYRNVELENGRVYHSSYN